MAGNQSIKKHNPIMAAEVWWPVMIRKTRINPLIYAVFPSCPPLINGKASYNREQFLVVGIDFVPLAGTMEWFKYMTERASEDESEEILARLKLKGINVRQVPRWLAEYHDKRRTPIQAHLPVF